MKGEVLARHAVFFFSFCHKYTNVERFQNIDFQTTILSRFDMIFIVKDEHNEQRDKVGPLTVSTSGTNVSFSLLQNIS